MRTVWGSEGFWALFDDIDDHCMFPSKSIPAKWTQFQANWAQFPAKWAQISQVADHTKLNIYWRSCECFFPVCSAFWGFVALFVSAIFFCIGTPLSCLLATFSWKSWSLSRSQVIFHPDHLMLFLKQMRLHPAPTARKGQTLTQRKSIKDPSGPWANFVSPSAMLRNRGLKGTSSAWSILCSVWIRGSKKDINISLLWHAAVFSKPW